MPAVSLTTCPLQYARGYGTSPAPTNDTLALALTVPTLGAVNVRDTNLTKIVFFGTGNVNTQYYAHVYAYSPVVGVSANTLWVPTLVCKVLCTLSNITGVTAAAVLNTEKFCDTILLVEGDPTVKISSDVDDRIASIVCDLEGATFMQVLFSNTALALPVSNANFLYATL